MNVKLMTAQQSDLPEIARVHIACFPDSFSTQLGEKLMAQYYGEYLRKDPGLFVIAVDPFQGNQIVGFCMGYVWGSYPFHKLFFKHNFIRLSLRCARLCAERNPLLFHKIKCIFGKPEAGEVLDRSILDAPDEQKGSLLSICVLDHVRGTGVAQQLISTYENRLMERGKTICTLCARAVNGRGNRFYDACGYHMYQRDSVSNRYAKSLDL